jgi:hypothetical protein
MARSTSGQVQGAVAVGRAADTGNRGRPAARGSRHYSRPGRPGQRSSTTPAPASRSTASTNRCPSQPGSCGPTTAKSTSTRWRMAGPGGTCTCGCPTRATGSERCGWTPRMSGVGERDAMRGGASGSWSRLRPSRGSRRRLTGTTRRLERFAVRAAVTCHAFPLCLLPM